jgi:hypothetical protein
MTGGRHKWWWQLFKSTHGVSHTQWHTDTHKVVEGVSFVCEWKTHAASSIGLSWAIDWTIRDGVCS